MVEKVVIQEETRVIKKNDKIVRESSSSIVRNSENLYYAI